MPRQRRTFTSMAIFFCIMAVVFASQVQAQICPSTSGNPWEWPSHSHWFFGNGYIGKFSGGNLSVTNLGNLTSYEGTTAASDDQGNLLFFSNGRLLWDATGMLTYTGLLEGNEGFMVNGSASQGVITVRHPLDPARYYIFTVDDANMGTANGLNYFVFDKNANRLSGPNRLGNYRTSEGIAATRHANGVDIWVTAYASGTQDFYTYLITCTGLTDTPVISPVAPNFSGQKERGGLAYSWDGKYFAQVHPDYFPNSDQEVSVYDFDKQTGIISNAHHISSATTGESPYDVLFSPDNTRLYVSTATGTLGTYDLSSWNTAVMSASYALIPGVSTGSHSAIEIGGDGNLYIATLGNPLGKLSGNMNTGNLTLSSVAGAITNRGLPTMYLPPAEEPDIVEAGPFCVSDPPADLSATWICTGLNAEDSVRNPNAWSGPGITDPANGIFNPAAAGPGIHMILFQYCQVDDTVYIEVNICACPDTSLNNLPPICSSDSLNLNAFVKTTETGSWSIAGGPAGYTATVTGGIFNGNHTAPGYYVIRYTLSQPQPGCPAYAERVLVVSACMPLVSLKDTAFCSGGCATIKETAAGGAPPYTYTWSNPALAGPGPHTVCPSATTQYCVTITDQNGDAANACMNVAVNNPPTLTTSGQDATCGVCDGSVSVTAAGNSPYNYNWDSGCTTAACTGMCPGSYNVTVTDANGCTSASSVAIGNIDAPEISASANNVLCFGDCTANATVTVTKEGIPPYTFLWSNSSTSPTASGLCAGNYTVTITDANGCVAIANTSVSQPPAQTITTSSTDEICRNCQGSASASGGGGTPGYVYSWINGSTSLTASGLCAGNYTVTVTDANGCTSTDSVTVNNMDILPQANFTANPWEALLLNPLIQFTDKSSDAISWHWSFGDGDTSIAPNPTHTYKDTGCYPVVLIIENQYGCRDTIPQTVCVRDVSSIYIPNAFTPNRDGKNEWFNIGEYNYCEFEMFIFDRWGNQIYQTTSLKGWDGTANGGSAIAQEDVYVWLVKAVDCYGKVWRRVGHVTLVR